MCFYRVCWGNGCELERCGASGRSRSNPEKVGHIEFFFFKKGIKKTRFFFVSISSEQTPKGAGAKTKKINNSREEAGVWSWMQSGESS